MVDLAKHDATRDDELTKAVSLLSTGLDGIKEHGDEQVGHNPPEPLEKTPAIQFDESLSDVPLNVPDLAEAIESIRENAVYDERDIRDAILSILLGHIMIAGPPGGGKTLLARRLAEAFNVTLLESTANAEWSVYDVIGSERLKPDGTTAPRMGVVTNAVIECYSTIEKQIQDVEAPQAVWLLIDEINRADIDRAFGAFFTALSGDSSGQFTLDFVQPPLVVPIPLRFRIIATLNSYDTSYVQGMSAALRRRFSRVLIKPFANDGQNRIPQSELNIALQQAQLTLSTLKGEEAAQQIADGLMPHNDQLARVFGAFRSFPGNSGLPIGTAQIIDTCRFLYLLTAYGEPAETEKSFWSSLDDAVVAKLMNSIESDATFGALDENIFPDEFAKAFPSLGRTTARLRAFLSGIE